MTAQSEAAAVYRIHPGIGIARLGDSPDEFCISPERPAGLPLACDKQGNPLLSPDGKTELTVTKFKDAEGRIKRQAARFHIYVYDDDSPCGRPLKIGEPIKGGGNHGVLVDIQWQVYLANKKSAWYEFDGLRGEHGFEDSHPLRNADITDQEARQRLIIDPGPRVIDATTQRSAAFNRECDEYAPTFPPELLPRSIATLGEIKTDDAGHLLVLGGHGNSGSIKRGFGQPRIDTYANNDGWFDDTSDGVVMARLVMFSQEVGRLRYIDVEYPAWVIVGYPAYVPEILDIITLDDVVHDLAIREFAERTDLYGEAGSFDSPQRIDPGDADALRHWKAGRLEWNPDYRPWFYRDVWPILFRADEMTHLTNVLEQSNFPHNQTARGNFDPNRLSVPPLLNETALARAKRALAAQHLRGDLFVEALEPALVLLDERLKVARPDAGVRLLQALEGVRERLRNAVSAFAQFASGGQPPDDPDAYLRRWREIYAQAQNPLEGAAGQAKDYAEALDKLKKVVNKVLRTLEDELRPPPAGPPPVLDALTLEAAERRPPSEAATEKTSPLSVEEAFERRLRELRSGKLLEAAFERAKQEHTYDFYRTYRMFLFDLLRQPNEENEFRLGGRPNQRTYHLPLMPLLAGDNPITNTLPSKFLRLTDYQLFILRQWAHGKFFNEVSEQWVESADPFEPYQSWDTSTGRGMDRGVLMNLLGGAFCPGGEVGWIMRNPAIYAQPYRIKADPNFYNFTQTAAQANRGLPPQEYIASVDATLSQDSNFEVGLQPGDLTKQMALPWQSDFNECSTEMIDVTYGQWNVIDPSSENDPWMEREQQMWETLWWPAHRPLQTYEVVAVENGSPSYQYLNWARGVPQTNAGDLKMVTEWARLGFVVRNPYLKESELDQPSPDSKYISVERTREEA